MFTVFVQTLERMVQVNLFRINVLVIVVLVNYHYATLKHAH